jgi:hypothetical protein
LLSLLTAYPPLPTPSLQPAKRARFACKAELRTLLLAARRFQLPELSGRQGSGLSEIRRKTLGAETHAALRAGATAPWAGSSKPPVVNDLVQAVSLDMGDIEVECHQESSKRSALGETHEAVLGPA